MATAALERAAAPAEASGLSETVLPEQPLWAQFQRIGGNLTPDIVTGILRDADIGRTARLVDLAHECRQKDGHLQAILSRREQAIASLQIRAVAEEGALRRDQKIAERLEEALKKCRGRRDGIAHLVGESLLFGPATLEVIWDVAPDGILVPVEFKRVSARRFGYRIADGVLLYDPSIAGFGDVNATGVDLFALHPPGKFIQHRRRVNGDVAVREGLARVLVWMALFRNWDLRDWLSLAEIGWKPWRLGKYNKDATTEDRLALRAIMQAMSATGIALFNKDTTEISVEWPKGLASGSVSTHKELADYLGSEMSKAVLCGTLTLDAGNKGARSLGDTHQESLDDLLESDAAGIGETLTAQLAEPFTRMNYGERGQVPTLVLPFEDEFDQLSFATMIKTLKDAGTRIPASFVREQAGIPEPDDDDEILGEADAQAAADAAVAAAEAGGAASPGDPAETPPAGQKQKRRRLRSKRPRPRLSR